VGSAGRAGTAGAGWVDLTAAGARGAAACSCVTVSAFLSNASSREDSLDKLLGIAGSGAAPQMLLATDCDAIEGAPAAGAAGAESSECGREPDAHTPSFDTEDVE
jgi:hypothetical protein